MPPPDWPPRFDPFRAIEREMGRVLAGLGPRGLTRAFRPYPAVNVYEAPDRFVLTAELPGQVLEQLELSITGESLTIKGQRVRPVTVPDESYRRQERTFGAWSRTLTLPARVAEDRVSASFNNGILTIVLPKSDATIARQIPIVGGQ